MEVGDDDDGNEQDSENEVLPTVESFKGSIVWIHFTKDPDFKENKKATCKHCSKVYVCSGGSTSNLKKHLKKHNIQMNQNHGQDIREMFSSSKVYVFTLFLVKFFKFEFPLLIIVIN
jgi:radical SAM protein with 4Fe4S-binding SPASM domain